MGLHGAWTPPPSLHSALQEGLHSHLASRPLLQQEPRPRANFPPGSLAAWLVLYVNMYLGGWICFDEIFGEPLSISCHFPPVHQPFPSPLKVFFYIAPQDSRSAFDIYGSTTFRSRPPVAVSVLSSCFQLAPEGCPVLRDFVGTWDGSWPIGNHHSLLKVHILYCSVLMPVAKRHLIRPFFR